MIFNMPVLVYEEDDCVVKHADDIAKFGQKALIVTGKHSAKANGSLDDVTKALGLHNISYVIFDEIEENPSIETVMKARKLFESDNIDFVIGIGGGSPLDAAKAISLMLANPDENESFLDKKTASSVYLPIIAIPTTCGTGSEVTGVSVLTRHSKRTKGSIAHKIYPTMALIDSKYLKAAPSSIIINTATDALAHLIESYLNSNATAYSKMFVHEGLRTWALAKDALLGLNVTNCNDKSSDNKNADNYSADEKINTNNCSTDESTNTNNRSADKSTNTDDCSADESKNTDDCSADESKNTDDCAADESKNTDDCSANELTNTEYRNLMNASTFAGMAIAHTGTSIPHGLSYKITYELKIPHGKACAYFLPGYLKEAPENDRMKLLNLAGFNDIEEFRDFLIKLCNLEPIAKETVSKSIEELAANEAKLKNCSYKTDINILNKIADYTLEQL